MPATKRKFAAPVGLLINSISTVDSSVASTTPSSGAFVITGGVGIGGTANITGSVNLWNSANTYYTGLRAGTLTTSTFYTLPTNYPGTGTSVLQSNTSGTLSWVPMTATGSTSSGAATTSQNINVVGAGSSNLAHSILFTPIASSSGSAISSDTTLSFNPSTEILSVSGLAVTAATGSSNTTTGALVVTGGVGIGGSLNVNNKTRFNDEVYINSLSNNALYITGSGSVAYTWTVGTTLTSGRYNLSSDLCLVPIGGSQSAIQTYWGMQLVGNNQLVPTSYSPSAVGTRDAFGVLIPNQQPASVGLAVIAHASQTGDLQIWTTPSGLATTTYLAVKSNGQLYSYASIASTNTTTGALVVRGGLGVSGQLSFVSASMGFTGITYNPTMAFIGATSSSPITLTVLTDNSLNWEGSQGSVFSIDNNLSSGEIFSVSDISGLPIISASAGQTVNINEFGGFTQIGNGSLNSSSTTTGSLVIAGGLGMTGNANIGGTVRITNTTATTSSSSGAFTVSGGAGIAQSLFVGGSIVLSNNIYSGGNNFAKAGQAPGDIIFDNNSNDTAGLLYYYRNNTNFGLDVFATGTGSTRFRIVKDLNESGGSELWSIDRNGVVARTGWDVGEVIATRVYNNTDLNMQATNTIGITSYVTIAEITYTPKSSSSYLWIEFDAHYDFNGGTTVDDFFSRITVGGSTIMEKNQIFLNAPGGGTRSGVLFPISGRYTNTSTSGIAITVQARRGTADDNLRVYGSSTSGYMRIQEIGR